MKRIISGCVVMLLFSSCSKLPHSVGKSRDVAIVSSKIDTTLIVNNLQIYNYVPHKEPTFIFLFAPDTAIKQVNKFHVLFLYGSLLDEFINTLLSLEAKEATKKDTFNLFKINNLWAKEQLGVILAVSEPEYISSGVIKYQKMIIKILEENYYSKIKKSYYEKGIDKRIKKHLRKFGFEFDFPSGWFIDSTFKKDNFIFIHTHYPDRSVFFYKEKKSSELSDSFAINKRNDLTKKYYNGDYILKELTAAEKIEFQDMKGIRLKGVWQNDSLVAGGPFLSYFLTNDDTLYVIDGMLFLPGERKTDYFTTLEVIMNSFKIH